MAITRWNPWRELERMQEDMVRTFGRPILSTRETMWIPDLDIYEKDNQLMVRMDLPDIDPKDIDISITDHMLKVHGERKQKEEVKQEDYYRMERRFGEFERSIELPVDVMVDQVEAKYSDGVLMITIPEAEEKKHKEIKVKVA